MASIVKRNGKYSVVYYYTDKEGIKHQKWETQESFKKAQKRKAEIENDQQNDIFIPPDSLVLSDFLKDFVSLYGKEHWGLSMYCSQTALIRNYIDPIIGNMNIQSITPLTVEKYKNILRKTHPVETKTRRARTEYLSSSTIENIIKLLHCAFNRAVEWEILKKNPFDVANKKKKKYKRRDMWDIKTICLALDHCTDTKLYVAMNLAFACSMRLGEILGLTWKHVHISDEDIASDNAYVYIAAELERVSVEALNELGEEGIYHIFPSINPNAHTCLVLKKPKTESSERKVWLPKTLAYILRDWKKSQDKLKEFLENDYQDYDLVISLPNGRPCENKLIEKSFSKLKKDAKLPNVVFHSLRHSSTTYKLKINHGDLKATQGDTGHAEIDMITEIYAHILDEDRKVNAQKFESMFYANPDLRNVTPPPEKSYPALDLASLIDQLQKSPELAQTLSTLLTGQIT